MVALARSEEAFERTEPGRPAEAHWTSHVVEQTSFFGKMYSYDPGPQAFLVHVEGEILPHFHEVNQFQIVVRNAVSIGKHRLNPVGVHYTDHHTPYGPICAIDGRSIHFYTLRARADVGSYKMPGSEKREPSGRSVTVDSGLVDENSSPAPERETVCTEVIKPHPDGLAAWSVRLASGATYVAPDPSSGGGQYLLVVNGECHFDTGAALRPRSVAWAGPDDAAACLRAASDGADVLVVQFPH
jgi:hypothetical protein